MNYVRMLSTVLLGLTLCGAGYPQDSHVQLRYFKDIDRTVVTSDLLYVVNTPTQFIQLQLAGRYPKQGPPTEPPDRIHLEFFSYAPAPLYQLDAAHRFAVKADEQILDFGLMGYSQAQDTGKDTDGGKKERLGVRAALPSVALVGANKRAGLTLELMSVTSMSLADLAKLARAEQVLMKIGSTVFALTATQMSILREFAASITPVNADAAAVNRIAPPAAANVPANVPSDTNNASLDETLKWLKTELERNGSAKEPVTPRKIEPLDFKSCRVRYRLFPLIRTSPISNTLVYAIMEYQMNLGDLNPEAVSTANLSEYSTIFLKTSNHGAKIKVITRANDNGFAGRTLDEKLSPIAVFSLSNANAAAQVKVALVHAINLCRAQP